MLEIVEMYRVGGENYTKVLLRGYTIRLCARSIKLWKFIYWGVWEKQKDGDSRFKVPESQ